MCGISGFLKNDGDSAGNLLTDIHRMSDTLVHRGPDDSGVWLDAENGLAFGFRRLSIIDLSRFGHQPMCSANSRFVIIFNGEIYNYRDLRLELEEQGVSFRGSSDTEVILEGTSRWGKEGIMPLLMGMFAYALWDRQEKVLLLARDRIGKKPLYYAHINGMFLFSSELKAMRSHPAMKAEIDQNALALYLRYGYIPAPYSIYRGVRKLPPGCYALIKTGGPPAIHHYWDVGAVAERGITDPFPLGDDEAREQLELLLKDSISRRMIADVPLGAFLSGGVDSATIVALMQAQADRPVNTFTIGFHESSHNEAGAARAIADHLGTNHRELYVSPAEAREIIPLLPQFYDEPFGDSSQIPTILVSNLASRHVKVCLSGDGGDEVFSGYETYHWAENLWNYLQYIPVSAQKKIARMIGLISPQGWSGILRSIAWLRPNDRRWKVMGDKIYRFAEILPAYDALQTYDNLISAWKHPDNVLLAGNETQKVRLPSDMNQNTKSFTECMMLSDMLTYLPDDILVKLDRASMSASLEGRCPLLDHRLIEWAWHLPLKFKVRNGQRKWLLRQVLYKYVPHRLVEKPKTGFGIPLGDWLRGPLREWAEALLDEKLLRKEGFFNPVPIRKAWISHLAGYRNEEHRLWIVLMFQAWKNQWMH